MKIIGVDRKNRNIGLSIKAKVDEELAVRDHQSREVESSAATPGDLIKAQMDKRGD